MPFAAALSAHPVTAHAVGEVTGQVLETLGDEPPDLAWIFLTVHHIGALNEVVEAIRHLLGPATLIGCTGSSVLANGRQVEDAPALTLWAGRFGRVQPISFGRDGHVARPDFAPAAALVLVDPAGFPVETALIGLGRRWPGLPVVGGMVSAPGGPSSNRLVLDDRIMVGGAVGALVGPGVDIDALVSSGARPVGRPYVVTAAVDNEVVELAGRSATERLRHLVDDELTEEEVAVVNRGGLCIGRVIDEHREEFGHGDFLVREILGGRASSGGLAVGDRVEVGQTLQFHIRDPESADDDLRAVLNGRSADAAAVFSDVGRGGRFFDRPHHDADVVADYLCDPPTTGFFAAGEVGPIGGLNFVHRGATSILLFREVSRGVGEVGTPRVEA